jgi:hypothetical protein
MREASPRAVEFATALTTFERSFETRRLDLGGVGEQFAVERVRPQAPAFPRRGRCARLRSAPRQTTNPVPRQRVRPSHRLASVLGRPCAGRVEGRSRRRDPLK